MATNLTKGKTTKTAVKVKTEKPANGAEVAAAVAAALRPKSPLDEVVSALTAAVGKAAAEKETQQAATPMHKFPVTGDTECQIGGELLLQNVRYAHALGNSEVAQEQVVMSHDLYGVISLRMVFHNDGYLIGLIDTNKATYCECEWFSTKKEAAASWTDWLTAAAY
jgi:hypothetical protein